MGSIFVPIGLNWDATYQIEANRNHPQANLFHSQAA
jgi:hypothetical protein